MLRPEKFIIASESSPTGAAIEALIYPFAALMAQSTLPCAVYMWQSASAAYKEIVRAQGRLTMELYVQCLTQAQTAHSSILILAKDRAKFEGYLQQRFGLATETATIDLADAKAAQLIQRTAWSEKIQNSLTFKSRNAILDHSLLQAQEIWQMVVAMPHLQWVHQAHWPARTRMHCGRVAYWGLVFVHLYPELREVAVWPKYAQLALLHELESDPLDWNGDSAHSTLATLKREQIYLDNDLATLLERQDELYEAKPPRAISLEVALHSLVNAFDHALLVQTKTSSVWAPDRIWRALQARRSEFHPLYYKFWGDFLDSVQISREAMV